MFYLFQRKSSKSLLVALSLLFSTFAYAYNDQNFSREPASSTQTQDSKGDMADQTLARKIIDKLQNSNKFTTGFDDVDIHVYQGVVTLQGSVRTRADQESLEKEIRNISGVRKVENQLSVQDANQRTFQNPSRMNRSNGSDQQLAQQIRDAFRSGWFSKGYDQVDVQVNRGVVTLQGSVNSREEMRNIENTIRNIPGVREINNRLNVQDSRNNPTQPKDFPQDRSASPADDQLNQRIRDKISRGWLWNNFTEISLNTSNGVVTLNGRLNNKDEERTLITDIQNIPGVRSVRSNLNINNR